MLNWLKCKAILFLVSDWYDTQNYNSMFLLWNHNETFSKRMDQELFWRNLDHLRCKEQTAKLSLHTAWLILPNLRLPCSWVEENMSTKVQTNIEISKYVHITVYWSSFIHYLHLLMHFTLFRTVCYERKFFTHLSSGTFTNFVDNTFSPK